MEVSFVPHHPSASVLEHHTYRVERHRPRASAELLQQLAPLLRHRGFCTATKAGQFALSNKSMYFDDSSEGLSVSLVKHGLVDGRKARLVIFAHLVRLLVQTEGGCFVSCKH